MCFFLEMAGVSEIISPTQRQLISTSKALLINTVLLEMAKSLIKISVVAILAVFLSNGSAQSATPKSIDQMTPEQVFIEACRLTKGKGATDYLKGSNDYLVSLLVSDKMKRHLDSIYANFKDGHPPKKKLQNMSAEEMFGEACKEAIEKGSTDYFVDLITNEKMRDYYTTSAVIHTKKAVYAHPLYMARSKNALENCRKQFFSHYWLNHSATPFRCCATVGSTCKSALRKAFRKLGKDKFLEWWQLQGVKSEHLEGYGGENFQDGCTSFVKGIEKKIQQLPKKNKTQ